MEWITVDPGINKILQQKFRQMAGQNTTITTQLNDEFSELATSVYFDLSPVVFEIKIGNI